MTTFSERKRDCGNSEELREEEQGSMSTDTYSNRKSEKKGREQWRKEEKKARNREP